MSSNDPHDVLSGGGADIESGGVRLTIHGHLRRTGGLVVGAALRLRMTPLPSGGRESW